MTANKTTSGPDADPEELLLEELLLELEELDDELELLDELLDEELDEELLDEELVLETGACACPPPQAVIRLAVSINAKAAHNLLLNVMVFLCALVLF